MGSGVTLGEVEGRVEESDGCGLLCSIGVFVSLDSRGVRPRVIIWARLLITIIQAEGVG